MNSVTEGGLLKQDSAQATFDSGTIDNTAGTVTDVYGAILGKHALGMLTKLTELLDSLEAHASVKRILVFDGAGNGVKTLRAFDNSDEYYLTILDDNQVKERKIKHIRQETDYKYGTSSLVDCQIELRDSSEKDYIHECRAVIVKWANGKRLVLITDIPRELLDASEVTKRYFDRWP